jgi:hypothetical protein
MIKTLPADAFKTANDLAVEWFKIHAAQRLTVFNFFLIIAGFCVGGFFTALQASNNLAASVIAFVLVVVSFCFKQLDRRTAQLTKLAENYLEESLTALGQQLDSQKINFVLLVEDKHGLWSYRKTFNILFWLFGIIGILGAVFPWMQQKILGINV